MDIRCKRGGTGAARRAGGEFLSQAIEKVGERALEKDKLRGLVWHTQGSGKTFTMIASAEQLIHRPELEKPTVLMLVDRNELESQLFQNLAAYGFGGMVVAERKTHLRELLKSGRRGLIATMIHKFERMPKNINTAPNIIVVHELLHLKVRSHGRLFKSLTHAYLPGWEDLERELNGVSKRR